MSDLKSVSWDEALLTIEHEEGVVLLLVSDHVPSRLLRDRLQRYVPVYSERGFVTISLVVTEDCACHPELAAVRLPQIRVFETGEETRRVVGVQDEDALSDLV